MIKGHRKRDERENSEKRAVSKSEKQEHGFSAP